MSTPTSINEEYDIIIAGGACYRLLLLCISSERSGQEALRVASSQAVLRWRTPICASSSWRRVLRHTTILHIRSPRASQPTSLQAHAPRACTPADQVLLLGAARQWCRADSVSAVEGASTVRLALLSSPYGCLKMKTTIDQWRYTSCAPTY